MRVLVLSLDRKILENGSAVQRRLVALGGRHGSDTERSQHGIDAEDVELVVLVPAGRDVREQISPHLTVYGVGGRKLLQLWKMGRAGKRILGKTKHLLQTAPFVTRDTTTPQPLLGKEGWKTYDLITVQDTGYLAFLAYLLARRFRIPFEVQVHGFEKLRGVRKRIARFVLRRADKIRVVSQRLKVELTKRYTLYANRFYVLPVYTQMGEKGRKGEMGGAEKGGEMGKGGEKGERGETGEVGRKRKGVLYPFTFLTVGRLVPVKNVALQIRAFARLAKEYPQIRLRIVGDGPERESLKLKVQSEKLGDKVECAGYQKEMSLFYEEADAFLLTSDSEGWGLAVTEAAAYGLPIIMTDVGCAGEFIKNEENGLVVPVGDDDTLLAAMRRVLEDVELRARLGAAARASFLALPCAEAQIQRQIEAWHLI